MSDDLPPLPEPFGDILYRRPSGRYWRVNGYTADQMRARDAMWAERLAAAVAMERGRCADICEQHASTEGIAQACAAAIRAGDKT